MRQRDKYIPELENVEIELLLRAIQRVHGIDLEEYSFELVRRCVWEAIRREKVRTISGLLEKLLHHPEAGERFLHSIVPPTHPGTAEFYARFRQDIVPLLKTYPFARLWQVGSHSTFDTYILAIILLEEGIYDKGVIYSTELNEGLLQRTQDGLFPMDEVDRFEGIYQRGGGRAAFSTYYSPGEESAMFDTALRKNIVFAQHSFATDSSFNEFNAIFCRTSLRVFDRPTQERAHKLFYDSLVLFGVLGLTPGESIDFSPAQQCFTELDRDHNLYRKIM